MRFFMLGVASRYAQHVILTYSYLLRDEDEFELEDELLFEEFCPPEPLLDERLGDTLLDDEPELRAGVELVLCVG
jgi:hypothetical protein